jgi:hypothetical protein
VGVSSSIMTIEGLRLRLELASTVIADVFPFEISSLSAVIQLRNKTEKMLRVLACEGSNGGEGIIIGGSGASSMTMMSGSTGLSSSGKIARAFDGPSRAINPPSSNSNTDVLLANAPLGVLRTKNESRRVFCFKGALSWDI